MHDRSRAGWLAASLAVLVVAAGCGTTPSTNGATPPTTAAATTRPATPPPADGLAGVADDPAAGLRGELLQFRRDVAGRRVEIRLTAANGGLLVDAVELRTTGLTAAPGVPRAAQLHRGLPLDLPVVLGGADCSGPTGSPAAEVLLRDAAGASRTVSLPLEDGGLADRLHESDCAEQALHAQAAIEVTDVREVADGDEPALRVDVRLSRVGGRDPVRVTDVGSNTVYAIRAVGGLPTLREQPVVLHLSMVPARCDTHALGESYRTGLIGLVLAVGDAEPRPFVLTPEDDVRRRLETFAVDTCLGRGD